MMTYGMIGGALTLLIWSFLVSAYLFIKNLGKKEQQNINTKETLNAVEEAVEAQKDFKAQCMDAIKKYMADKYTRDK